MVENVEMIDTSSRVKSAYGPNRPSSKLVVFGRRSKAIVKKKSSGKMTSYDGVFYSKI